MMLSWCIVKFQGIYYESKVLINFRFNQNANIQPVQTHLTGSVDHTLNFNLPIMTHHSGLTTLSSLSQTLRATLFKKKLNVHQQQKKNNKDITPISYPPAVVETISPVKILLTQIKEIKQNDCASATSEAARDNLITESDVWRSLILKTNRGGMTWLLLL